MGAKAITVPERKRPPETLAPRAAPRLSWAPTAGTEDGTAMQPERFGRYEVVAEIGDGAMGRVYKARDPVVQRFVAIKTIKSEYLTRDQAEEYLKRFRREAQAAGSLTHPNIVRIFDVGENHLVMEMLEGEDAATAHQGTWTDRARGGPGHPEPGGRCPRPRPRGRHHPSGHQARQHHDPARTDSPSSWTSAWHTSTPR